MNIGSNSASFFINQFSGTDASSQRIKKAIDAAGKTTPFDLVIKASGGGAGSNTEGSGTPVISWGNILMNLGAADGAIHIEDIIKVADAAMRDAKSQLDSAFSSASISNSPDVTFSFDLDGQLVVGDHPQKEEIQKLLRDNDDLTDNLREAMILKENAVSNQKAAHFTEAYQRTYSQKGQAAAQDLWERYMAIGDAKTILRYGGSGFVALFNGKNEQEYLASVMKSLGLGKGLRADSFA